MCLRCEKKHVELVLEGRGGEERERRNGRGVVGEREEGRVGEGRKEETNGKMESKINQKILM